MLTDSFDNLTPPIITPASFYPTRALAGANVAILTFSVRILGEALRLYPHEEICSIGSVNGARPVYLLHDGDFSAVLFLVHVGASPAGSDVIELNWLTGADRFIMFGSAGSLENETTAGKYVIPTAAYRDEGMSYHYAPPADYIDIKNADFMADFFARNKLPYVKGRVWTTDAIYRETRGHLQRRKAEGCIAVDMELAGVQAVCDYHGLHLYNFLVTGDVVDQPDYTPEGLYAANNDMDKFEIAWRLAKELASC